MNALNFLRIAPLCLMLVVIGCNRGNNYTNPPPGKDSSGKTMPPGNYTVDLPKPDPKLGTAVVILVDTSGSMGQKVGDKVGKQRPKHELAREALENIIQSTAKWKKDHPKANLQLAIYSFNSSVSEVLPMGDFDADKAKQALKQLPPPNSGTAIGKALETGFKALYRSGCTRKFVVCVTDGENTVGPSPDWIARHLHYHTGDEVEMQFVAFDTLADHFRFLKEVNGHVVQASDGAKLQSELERIYQERILVEKEEPEKK